MEWPEQQVRILDEEKSPLVKKLSYRVVGGTARQMVVEVPVLPAGKEARAVVTFEVTRQALLEPESTSVYLLPKASENLRPYLLESPYIETRHPKIIAAAKEAASQTGSAWQQVEAIYDWTRQRVQYKEGPLKGAREALEDGDGDCEELSSLFIALCRVNKIPARLVWVPGHCYPEFCLQDEQGEPHWFPCQAAGERAFGTMTEYRPILQKGDNFRLPDRPKDRHRYVSEGLTGLGGQPTVRFIREVVQDK
jgi:transglutaminase-like putative cysteine protease